MTIENLKSAFKYAKFWYYWSVFWAIWCGACAIMDVLRGAYVWLVIMLGCLWLNWANANRYYKNMQEIAKLAAEQPEKETIEKEAETTN